MVRFLWLTAYFISIDEVLGLKKIVSGAFNFRLKPTLTIDTQHPPAMIIDAHSLVAGHLLEYDVCIVGSGPAGITLAKQLTSQRVRVLLLESGGLEHEDAPQTLNEGSSTGSPQYLPLEGLRSRQFGGTANQWHIDIGDGQTGVRYMPMDEVDFEQRDWLPHSCGWPFSGAHLQPYYERAHLMCRAGNYAYDADNWERNDSPRLPLPENKLVTKMFQFGPSNVFTQQYRDELANSKYASVCIHANVTEIETTEDARSVTSLRVKTLEGKDFRVEASVFVLAAGGIENARLLLLSNQIQKHGLGNANDLVGRFFMDHPLVQGGTIIPRNRDIFRRLAMYDMRWFVNNCIVMGKVSPNEEYMRQERLLNGSTLFFPKGRGSWLRPAWTERQIRTLQSARKMFGYLKRGKRPPGFLRHCASLAIRSDALLVCLYRKVRHKIKKHSASTPNITWGGWSENANTHKRFDTIEVIHQTEQVPHPDNRIVLGDETDALGQRKAHLVWNWMPEDVEGIMRIQELIKESFEAANLGTFNIARDNGKPVLLSPTTHHHMGTTRMHHDPEQGVVNADSQVHGIDNLFVAGSSVFPSGGYANPTLTIVALSIRLADHIHARLAVGRKNHQKPEAV